MAGPAQRQRVLVIGGGAAGFFGAIRCAGCDPAPEVVLHEATAHPLAKVRISGGGRCNVTHGCFEPRELAAHYPRGSRELIGPFHRFGPRETMAWFAARGVELKTEADGRVFPSTDRSATVIAALVRAAEQAGVRIVKRRGVASVERDEAGGFVATLKDKTMLRADRVLLATGGAQGSAGIAIARSLGHAIEPQVPSLFTFHVDDARLRGLEGLAVADACATVPGTRLSARGPILITHWGLSGPAILRLSAWGARELHANAYRFRLVIDWTGGKGMEEAGRLLALERVARNRRQVVNAHPAGVPARLWERLVAAAGLSPTLRWAGLSNAGLEALAGQLGGSEFHVAGKSLNKEEFVTCGGVRLDEVDFRTMESRVCPGLHLAGEILDIDGVTGGFNFQAAWTTGWIAGAAMAGAG